MKSQKTNALYRKILTNEKAFYFVDLTRFKSNVKAFRRAFLRYYQNVEIGYSYKTNYLPAICEVADHLGCAAEVVSDMEVQFANKIRTSSRKLIFNGPIKSVESFKRLPPKNCIINIDSASELFELINFHKNAKPKPQLDIAIRLNIDYLDQNSRFGVVEEEVQGLIQQVRATKGLRFVGFHLHLPNRSLESFEYRIESILKFLERFTVCEISYLNLGGGFFGPLPMEILEQLGLKQPPQYSDYAKIIGSRLSEFYKNHCKTVKPALYLEPGSALVADAVSFVSRIHKVHSYPKRNIIVSYCARHLVSPTNKTIQLPIHLFPIEEAPVKRTRVGKSKFIVVGYTCIEGDTLGELVSSKCPSNRDGLEIRNCGSYSIVMASDFILPRPPIYVWDGTAVSKCGQSISPMQIFSALQTEPRIHK